MPLIPEAHDIWFAASGAAGRSPATIAIHRYATKQLAEWRGNPDLTTVSRFECSAE
jgi:hypothetical protein